MTFEIDDQKKIKIKNFIKCTSNIMYLCSMWRSRTNFSPLYLVLYDVHIVHYLFFHQIRHKQVMLEAYDQQCDEAAKIFAEYQRRLHQYVNQARDIRRLNMSGADAAEDLQVHIEKEAVYSTVKGNRLLDDVVLIETSQERNIRKACETLAGCMIEVIHSTFPAYEGSGINVNSQLDAVKLGIDLEGEIPEDVKAVATDALNNPLLLLQSITMYTSRVKTLIHKETEKIDIRADAELLRYHWRIFLFHYCLFLFNLRSL